MSFRTQSRSMPIVVTVFCVGLGLGLSWKLGYLPVSLSTPGGGSLDPAQSASDGGSPEQEEIVDPAWAVDQGEPPVEEGVNWKSDVAAQLPPSPSEPPPFVRSSRSATKATEKPRRTIQTAAYQDELATEEEPADEPAEPSEPKRMIVDPLPAEEIAADDRFAEIDAKLANGEFLAAHKLLSKMHWNAKGIDDELQRRLEASAKKIFFSPQPHFIEPYVVQSGDQLRKIAGKYQLSWEYLAALNKTDPRRIRDGQKLKVLKGPFAAIVNLRDFSLTVHLQGYYVKRYDVGIGKDGSSPIGKFAVLDKLENPQYTDPDGKVFEGDDPANPLGERWIDLGDSYGIHGTIDPESIGKAESRGCIRLKDADIVQVYNFLVKNSVVEIRE